MGSMTFCPQIWSKCCVSVDTSKSMANVSEATSSANRCGPSEQLLARNLAALAVANPVLAETLRHVGPSAARFFLAADGTVTGELPVGGAMRPLGSRHRPLDEADELVETIDLAASAVLMVVGFGLGHHVRRMAERMERTGVVAVYEPDLSLLRDVLSHVDHSQWIRATNLIIVNDLDDRGEWSRRFGGIEVVLVQGVKIVEHPPSRQRLGDAPKRISERMAETVRAARLSMSTTLVRSVATANAYLGNIAQYAAGGGCAELHDIAKGRLGVVVSAGPSLRKNIHLLAEPGVRERCVIVSTQTTLKPLLDAGVRPHFVCALDWHHISKRFYEGIREEDVSETTLIVDPQANPVIPRSFPGPVRCFQAEFLRAILGPVARDMGRVQTGNTVAHLCYTFARWLGCDPVALIGQDLGFTDGLYYSRGTAIDDVWAPELNPFNTVEMMEWQRIMRHKIHLRKVTDVHGRSIYTDSQMESYLNKFEMLFTADRSKGLRTIDATEGGVAKSATEVRTLREALDAHAVDPIPAIPLPPRILNADLLGVAAARVREVRRDVLTIQETSERTAAILTEMMEHQSDQPRMAGLWPKLQRERKVVEGRLVAFEIVGQFNQLGVFKRAKADRNLHFARHLPPLELQRAQLERDLTNVRWTADAAKDLARSLERAIAALEGREIVELDEAEVSNAAAKALDEAQRGQTSAERSESDAGGRLAVEVKVKASFVVPIDHERGGSGAPRALDSEFGGRTVLQRTLERLGRSSEAESIVLLVADAFDPEPLIDRRRIGLPVEIERCGSAVFGPDRDAIIAARLWSDMAWRGGVAGISVYDEVIAPDSAVRAMERLGLTAAVFVGPDWPCVQVDGPEGCDALVRRHREAPGRLPIVFTQAPPGLCGVLLGLDVVQQLRLRNRLSTIGSMLVYQPHLPQPDPISLDVCVPIDHRVRSSFVRAIFDTPRTKMRMRRGLEPLINDADNHGRPEALPALAVVNELENQLFNTVPYFGPQHVLLELCTGRQASGAISPHRWGSVQRLPMTLRRAERIFSQLAESGDAVVTLGGVGDPLNHPDFDVIIRMAKDSGVRGVHVRTELLAGPAAIDRLLGTPVDVVSVDVQGVSAATYLAQTGVDRFNDMLAGLGRLLAGRRHVSGPAGRDAIMMPWVCPRIQRRAESYEDIDPFFEHWSRMLGTAIIDGPIPFDPTDERAVDPLASARAPERVAYRELHRRMVVLSDGSVPISELDLHGERTIGNVDSGAVLELWRTLVQRRRQLRRELGPGCEALRIATP
jgi:hypothetical protein